MNQPTILILVGITGDLSKRKLLPAIENLKAEGRLPKDFELVGITRRDDPTLFKMNLDNADDYQRLAQHLSDIESRWGHPAQRLFYLSVAPTVALPIVKQLGDAGLAAIPNTKLLLEKPIGTDLENAKHVMKEVAQYFDEEHTYRIDHYLEKDSVRNLAHHELDTNGLTKIEIIASEKLGIEGRGHFYDQTGALRDLIQNHLLEVTAMAISPSNRLDALEHLSVPADDPIAESVKRGQYLGYRETIDNPDSVTETRVSVKLVSSDPNLENIAIELKTGKGLDKKSTDIFLTYEDGHGETISLNDARNAYENVFLDAIAGNKTFFVSQEEVIATWTILAPIQDYWKTHSDDLEFYEQGSGI